MDAMKKDFEIFQDEHFGKVRTFLDNHGEIWFVGKDVCDALGIVNHSARLAAIDLSERTLMDIKDIHGRVQPTVVIKDSGMYELVLTSRKKEAKAFKQWITREVIPSIRNHGGYLYGQEYLSEQERMQLRSEIKTMADKVAGLRTRRHDLLAENRKLKEQRRHFKEEKQALTEHAKLFEGLYESTYRDYVCVLAKNAQLKHELEQKLHGVQTPAPSEVAYFVDANGFVTYPSMQQEKQQEEEQEADLDR